jgi:hypothetical protein
MSQTILILGGLAALAVLILGPWLMIRALTSTGRRGRRPLI